MSETFSCPRGAGADSPFVSPFNGEDATWKLRPNGDRVCSYCGSLHPDDFLDIITRYGAGEEGYSFDLTGKSYKVYAKRPGVVSALDGGIKFYGHHAVAEDHPARAAHEAAWRTASHRFWQEHAARYGSQSQ